MDVPKRRKSANTVVQTPDSSSIISAVPIDEKKIDSGNLTTDNNNNSNNGESNTNTNNKKKRKRKEAEAPKFPAISAVDAMVRIQAVNILHIYTCTCIHGC